jgi:putative ABC transport system permease protein
VIHVRDTISEMRIAIRALLRARTFTITTVLILGIGIGMAAAMVSVFRSVLVTGLPVRDQNEVVVLWTYRDPAVEFGTVRKHLDAVRENSRTLAAVAGVVHWNAASAPLLDGDRPIVMNRTLVTPNFFEVLGSRPYLGRLLNADDAEARVMVLSYAAWRREFGGDPTIIGRQLTEPYQFWRYTVVGVAPPGLDYPAGVSFWIPLWPNSDQQSVYAVVRLAPGGTAEQARAEFFASVSRQAPELKLVGAKAVPFAEVVLGDVRPVLGALTAAAMLLLLIACVNVGNLLLLRATSRAQELAIRRALGATVGDIARQSLLESALLGVAGGSLGLACADVLRRALLAFAPSQLPRADVIELSGAPIAIAVAVTLGAIVVFGVLPAVIIARSRNATMLRMDARSGRESPSRRRARRLLVASQVALALMMLSGAALLGRSLARLQRLDLGYTPSELSILAMSLPAATYTEPSQWYPLGEAVMQRWRGVAGVTSVTPIMIPPFIGPNVFVGRVDLEGQGKAEREGNPFVPMEVGNEDYFRTMGIPILRGRGMLATDRENAPPVAVVSETIARRLWAGEDPIGKRIQYWSADSTSWRTVVGVAGDIHFRSLREATPTIYMSWRQAYWQMQFAVRTAEPLEVLLPALRRAVREVDPRFTLWDARTMDDLLAAPLAQPRMSAVLMGGFGLVALLLAAIGLYGVMASIVREQTREIGIRMALGATAQRVRRAVLGDALAVCGIGAAVGIAGTLFTSGLLARLLFEVSPTDPIALGSACVVLLIVAVLASYVPARWATRIDPASALRAD